MKSGYFGQMIPEKSVKRCETESKWRHKWHKSKTSESKPPSPTPLTHSSMPKRLASSGARTTKASVMWTRFRNSCVNLFNEKCEMQRETSQCTKDHFFYTIITVLLLLLCCTVILLLIVINVSWSRAAPKGPSHKPGMISWASRLSCLPTADLASEW